MVNEIAGTPTSSMKRARHQRILVEHGQRASFKYINLSLGRNDKAGAGIMGKSERFVCPLCHLFYPLAFFYFQFKFRLARRLASLKLRRSGQKSVNSFSLDIFDYNTRYFVTLDKLLY